MHNTLIGASPAPTFDDPLQMLLACHGRIEVQCVTLNRLIDHLSVHGNEAQAKQAAGAILRYFDSAGPFHHLDEEQDLFPMLLATRNNTAAILIARLLQEHSVMEEAWKNLRPLLLAIAEDHSGKLDASIAQHFIAVYAAHIEIENGELLPLAATLLNAENLREIGQNMAARRGVTL